MLFKADLKTICLLVGIAFLVCACTPASKQSTPMPSLDALPESDIDEKESPGSLYQPSNANYLFADNRANRVGDIVLVEINEDPTAESGADTTAEKTTNTNIGVDNFMGKEKVLGAFGDVGGSIFGATSETSLEGTGTTERNYEIENAVVAARVVRVLPNQLLQVEGGKKIRVNEETQIIVVRGLIRSRDINANNMIKSEQLANAHIEFYGKGILSDKQRPGWLTRILDNVWPF
jgi:flagellar L-ring protein precursor FlgH